MPIRVLTVDDSPFFLELLAGIVEGDDGLELVGSARDGREAVEKVISLCPDVVTLDVEMPVMDGLAALERIRELGPTPVIMVSTHTRRASAATVRALQLGASDFVLKPEHSLRESLDPFRVSFLEAIHAVARSAPTSGPPLVATRPVPRAAPRVVIIGSSTGGVAALSRIFRELPERPKSSIIAVQHMPGTYTAELARTLAESVRCPVRQARDGELVEEGGAWVAPGGFHLSVYGTSFRVSRGEPVNGHCPSIDVAMSSVVRSFGSNVCAVLLTGIGKDGARGIVDTRKAGGYTVAQDEASSVVFGMPRAAIATGMVDRVLPLAEIAAFVREIVR